MNCHICSRECETVCSAMLRPWLESRDGSAPPPNPDSVAYQQYCRNTTFRRAFICETCYRTIDADLGGLAEIPGYGQWNLAGKSRADAAPIYDRQKWERFQRSKAKEMGIDW